MKQRSYSPACHLSAYGACPGTVHRACEGSAYETCESPAFFQVGARTAETDALRDAGVGDPHQSREPRGLWARKRKPGARSTIAVVNATRSTVLATRVTLATSEATRARGLLGRSELARGEGLILRPCKGVHSFGMKFAIDVAYVTDAGVVVRVVAPLLPGKAGPMVWRASWVLELPEGVLGETGTLPGDRLVSFYYR